MEDIKRSEEAKKIIIDIFHKYEELSGFGISDEKYDEVRWITDQAKKLKAYEDAIEVIERIISGEIKHVNSHARFLHIFEVIYVLKKL